LIDYKTGLAAVDWRGERPDNPQLPHLRTTAPRRLVAVAYGRVNAAECSFIAEAERLPLFKAERPEIAARGLPTLAALIDVGRSASRILPRIRGRRAAVAPRACLQILPAARIVPRAGGARGCGGLA